MQAAGLGNGEQAGGSMLSSRATITEADLAPLYAGSQGTFGAVIGGLDASVLQKGEQPLGMFKQRPCQVLDLAIRAVQMGLSQNKQTPLEANRSPQPKRGCFKIPTIRCGICNI